LNEWLPNRFGFGNVRFDGFGRTGLQNIDCSENLICKLGVESTLVTSALIFSTKALVFGWAPSNRSMATPQNP